MKFGLIGANVGAYARPDGARALATAAERHGFDSLWTFEHVIAPVEYDSRYPYASTGKAPRLLDADMPDPIVWLSHVAAVTSEILLGTGILILPQRNPVVLAKEVATLDVLSGGRAQLGVGVGWLEEEFDALGVPFARRGARMDEYIEAMRVLWTGEDVSFDGEFVSFDDVRALPAATDGAVPIHVGGHSEIAAKRAGRLGDGFYPALDADSIEELGLDGALQRLLDLADLARDVASASDRDPKALEVSITVGVAPPAEVVAQLDEADVDRLLLFTPTGGPEAIDDELAELADTLGID